ncbi:MAG TPA: DUF1572 family protein [Gemmatimonadaceae bacterium]|nr:DUF1572 family protein [Gemmatimonadaceae bacterium]
MKTFAGEYARYRLSAEKAFAQVSDDGLNQVLAPDGNSIAMLVRHISGNFVSRFTDFLAADGEKPDRNRDDEFADAAYSRAQMDAAWARGWSALDDALAQVDDAQLSQTITIRGQPLTVAEALCRSLAHVAMHVGQIILIARILAGGDWKWITIPKGQSAQYNRDPSLERRPSR